MTDSCPGCCERGIDPHATRTGDTQTIHAYRCPRCGATWTTSRLREAYEADVRLPRAG